MATSTRTTTPTASPPLSENEDWLSVLSYSTAIAFPLAIHTALKLDIFQILHTHGPLSAQQIAPLLPRRPSNPRAHLFLDRLLYLLSQRSLSLTRPLLAASPSPSDSSSPAPLQYSLLPPAHFFLRDPSGVCLGEYFSERTLTLLKAYQHLDSVIVDGGDGFHREFGHDISHHVAEHAAQNAATMASMTTLLMDQLLATYDGFKDVGVLADVGGATGYTLVHILEKYPQLQGINYDQPHMVANGVIHSRLRHVGGSMLESIPFADAILMKLILHDWEDGDCITIFKNCKLALNDKHGKVVVIETYISEIVEGYEPKHHLDIVMMASHGGKVRTPADYKNLGQAAGFRDMEVAAIVNEYCVLEFLL